MHAAQIRAARGLLNWRQDELARRAKVATATIQRIEKSNGPVMGYVSTQVKIQQALERAGIRFIEADATGGIGVRLESGPPRWRGKRRT